MRVTWLFIACGLIYVVGFGLRILGGFGFDNNLVVFIISVCLIYIVPYVPTFQPSHPSLNASPLTKQHPAPSSA